MNQSIRDDLKKNGFHQGRDGDWYRGYVCLSYTVEGTWGISLLSRQISSGRLSPSRFYRSWQEAVAGLQQLLEGLTKLQSSQELPH